MPTYEVTSPDGKTWEVTAPDGATQDQVLQYAKQQWQQSRQTGQPAQQPSAPALPSGQDLMRERRQAVANQVGGLVRGAGSIGATLLSPFDMASDALAGRGLSLESNRQRRSDMDAALQSMIGADPQSGAYRGMKTAAEIGGTMGVGGVLAKGAQAVRAAPQVVSALQSAGFTTGAAPATVGAKAADLALRTAAGGVVGGASAGLVNPDDAATGAKVGAALPGAMKAAGAVGTAIGRSLSPNIKNPELARKAINEYGIPLGPADISASQMTKGLRSVLNDAPFTHGIGARQGEAVQEGFNRAIGKTFGADATKLTPEVMDQARQRMGAEFDKVWGRNALTVDVDFAQRLAALRDEAKKLPQGESARLMSWLEDVASKAVDDGAGNFFIPGDVANRLQSKLGRDASTAQGFLKEALSDLRRGMLEAFNRGVTPEDAAALTKARSQYKAYKTVEPLLQKAEAGVAGRDKGDIPAALLPEAVRQSYRSGIGSSPFADLTQIGSQYVADRVARTGGSARAWIQNGAIGSALGMGAFTNPLAAGAVIPAALATQKALGSPRVAQALANAQPNALMLPPELQAAIYRVAPVAISGRSNP